MNLTKVLKLAALALIVPGLGISSGLVGVGVATLTVCPAGCQYTQIQEAINAAAEGDTIQVGADGFTGKVTFQGNNVIEGNNTSGNQNGMGNPGSHPFTGLPDGQVCLP